MLKRLTFGLLPVLILLAVPLLLKPSHPVRSHEPDADSLVIVSPHTAPVRAEFERAFRAHYKTRTGRDVVFDWRNVGGTSDIVRYIQDRYEAEFRTQAKNAGQEWDESWSKAFKDPSLSPEQHPARKLFLDSDTSIGIDLFFGGGTYDQGKFAKMGIAVDGGVQIRHPEWFAPDVIPRTWAGEVLYDPNGGFYGVCLSSFGLLCNLDRLRELNLPLPKTWTDLTHPSLFQKIAVADPTKSGSITKCYEMILQQAMNEAGPEQGWKLGFDRIRLIAANSRYVTDSAGQLVRDVSAGAAAVGMCIDFYGLSEAAWTNAASGTERVRYIFPENGSSVSADPVQLLRGAPNETVAKAFLDFLLSPEGQRIWIQKPGTPGGPAQHELLRPCIRRDVLEGTPGERMSDILYNPYKASGTFAYQGAWTGPYFSLIRVLIKCIALDPMDELRDAYAALLARNAPPDAFERLLSLPVSYAEAKQAAADLNGSPGDVAALRRAWTTYAIRAFRAAVKMEARNP